MITTDPTATANEHDPLCDCDLCWTPETERAWSTPGSSLTTTDQPTSPTPAPQPANTHVPPWEIEAILDEKEKRIAGLCETVVRLRLERNEAREQRDTAQNELAEISAALAPYDNGGSFAFQVQQLAAQHDDWRERYARLAGEVARIADELSNEAGRIYANHGTVMRRTAKAAAKDLRAALAATAPQTAQPATVNEAIAGLLEEALDRAHGELWNPQAPQTAPSAPQSQDLDQDVPQWERDFLARQDAAESALLDAAVTEAARIRVSSGDQWSGLRPSQRALVRAADVYQAQPTPADPGPVRETADEETRCTATTKEGDVTLRCEHEAGHDGWHDADLVPPPGRVGWMSEDNLPPWARTAGDEHLQALRDGLAQRHIDYPSAPGAEVIAVMHWIDGMRRERRDMEQRIEARNKEIDDLRYEAIGARREAELLRDAVGKIAEGLAESGLVGGPEWAATIRAVLDAAGSDTTGGDND